jgi:hypothetical protein
VVATVPVRAITLGMPTEPHPDTTAEAVHRAVEVCEAGEVDGRLGELLARFEDADENEISADALTLLRLAARAEFHGVPPHAAGSGSEPRA